MSGWTVILVGAVAAGASFGGWTTVRKGENQVLIRTSVVLTILCCYLMWAIIYLAQLHPLIKPKRGDLRHET